MKMWAYLTLSTRISMLERGEEGKGWKRLRSEGDGGVSA